GVFQQVREANRGERRQLVRLRDDGVAAEERRKRFPRDTGQRAVERHDRGAHANRRAHGPHAPVRDRARHRPAVEATAFALHEQREVGGRADFGGGVLPRLAGFEADDFGELALRGAQQRPRAAEDLAALRGGQPPPRVGGAFGGVDRATHVDGGPARYVRDDAIVDGRSLLERRGAG